MNGFYSLHESQRLCSIPTSIQKSLREKIKDSDFLVADDKGVHRLVGLKYDCKTMYAPIVTFVCMRHEMPAAKQIAVELGKKIFCDSKASSRIFNLKVGEEVLFLDLNDYVPLAKMYADFLGEKHSLFNAVSGNGMEIFGNGVIYIKGQALPARPKLSDLTELLGEPDNKEGEQRFYRLKVSFWADWTMAVRLSSLWLQSPKFLFAESLLKARGRLSLKGGREIFIQGFGHWTKILRLFQIAQEKMRLRYCILNLGVLRIAGRSELSFCRLAALRRGNPFP